MGVTNKTRKWTEKELTYLKTNFYSMLYEDLIVNLNRTRYAIRSKAECLRLKRKSNIGRSLPIGTVRITSKNFAECKVINSSDRHIGWIRVEKIADKELLKDYKIPCIALYNLKQEIKKHEK